MAKMSAWRFSIAVVIVLCSLYAMSEAVPCGVGYGPCPSGECCGSNGQCGTTDAFCGAGCNAEYGTCKGLFHNFEVAWHAPSFELVDVVFNPEEPLLYAFVNVKGPIAITQSDGQVLQYSPFIEMEDQYRGMILQYNTSDMTFMHFAMYGSYGSPPDYLEPKADFTFVRALWMNDTLWAAYNLGPSQGEPSNAVVAFYRDAGNQVGLTNLGNTGVVRIEASNLIPNTTVGSIYPAVASFPNLTSSDLHFDGVDLHMVGSFVMSPLEIPSLNINERPGDRGECNDASREEGSFKWCPGTEDGWNIQISVDGTQVGLHTPNFVYSQATGGEPRYLKAISVSGDNDGGIYNCYISNNDYVIVSESGDDDTFTANATSLNRTQTDPALNNEIFCTISTENTFSFTNLAFNGGSTSNLYAAALPSSANELVSAAEVHHAATGTSYTLLNISGVQGVGEEMGYILQSGYDWAHVTDLHGTSDSEILVAGTFNGTLSGDPANPITNIQGPANFGSAFFFYYQRSESPSQIQPTNVFAISHFNVDFQTTKATLMPDSTMAQPKVLLSSTIVANQIWTYNNTLLPSTPSGRQAFFWGIYESQTNTVPGPIFSFPAPSNPTPSSSPTTSSPTTSSPGEPASSATSLSTSFALSVFILALIAILF